MAGFVPLEAATLSRIDLLEETVRVTLMRTCHQISCGKAALTKIELRARNVTECAPRVQQLDETGKTEGPSGLTFVIHDRLRCNLFLCRSVDESIGLLL